jgi:hypothetical protein
MKTVLEKYCESNNTHENHLNGRTITKAKEAPDLSLLGSINYGNTGTRTDAKEAPDAYILASKMTP